MFVCLFEGDGHCRLLRTLIKPELSRRACPFLCLVLVQQYGLSRHLVNHMPGAEVGGLVSSLALQVTFRGKLLLGFHCFYFPNENDDIPHITF